MRGPHGHQVVVILAPVTLEKVGQVKGRLVQQAKADQIEHDKQPPQPPVPVQKWMDRFELIMDERDLEQVRDMDLIVVDELLQIAHEVRHVQMMRRHEGGILEADADPVLAAAEFAGLFVLAAHALEQHGMRLA